MPNNKKLLGYETIKVIKYQEIIKNGEIKANIKKSGEYEIFVKLFVNYDKSFYIYVKKK